MSDLERLSAAATAGPLNPVEFAQLLGRDYYTGPFAGTEASHSEAQRAYIEAWALAMKHELAIAAGDLVERDKVDESQPDLRSVVPDSIADDAVREALDTLMENRFDTGSGHSHQDRKDAALATLTAALADRERLARAVQSAQDYINNVLGVPSPDFLATVARNGGNDGRS